MSVEQAGHQVEQIGQIELGGRDIDVYARQTQLPDDPGKRGVCEAHIAEGRADELYSEFWMAGCVFPGEGEDSTINTQLACKGLSRFAKRCRLTLIQYGPAGEVLNKGEFE